MQYNYCIIYIKKHQNSGIIESSGRWLCLTEFQATSIVVLLLTININHKCGKKKKTKIFSVHCIYEKLTYKIYYLSHNKTKHYKYTYYLPIYIIHTSRICKVPILYYKYYKNGTVVSCCKKFICFYAKIFFNKILNVIYKITVSA